MQKTKLEYVEKHHILEVDGIEYEIPQRTAKLETKIREHDEKLGGMTEYEANMSLLEILFGKTNARKMFPDKENTNLDRLAKCTKLAIALYMAEYTAIKEEEMKSKLSAIEPVLNQLNGATDILQKTQSNHELQKVIKKKK